MNYKDTLLMPHSDFEMRGNLPAKEPNILERWENDNHYQQILKKNEGKQFFILHDGPPYANGNLHAGTAMNRIIKDIIVRSKAMAGYYTPFFPGWDTHGLPIENAIQKTGVNRKQVSAKEFREKCEEYAKKYIQIQMDTEKRLGQVADYDNPYITLLPQFEQCQIQNFAKMALDGMIFQGLKPIYWSPFQETAIADSEIIYFDKEDISIYVAFDVVDGKGVLDGDEKFVIWTTTPWTMPANLAIALNPEFNYAVVNTSAGKLIVLENKVEHLLSLFNLENKGILKIFKGKELEYITTKHPMYDKNSIVILGGHVVDGDGTGCVHTAPGHGAEDFFVGQKYNLKAFCPVDEKGLLTKEAGEKLAGLLVFDANEVVIKMLKENGSLLATEKIKHSYPHDDRLKKPVIFRATVQWFASIEKIKPNLLNAIKNVKWHNSFGEIRLSNMIKDRKDWCISRQRLWGVPIPIIYNEDKSPIIEKEVFDNIAKLIGEHGSNYWFEKEAKDLLPVGYTNPKSPNGLFTKETDIMDVWFDSGSSWNQLQKRGYSYPCDLYFEGSDQYRGWFNSSLSVSVAVNNTAPYKAVLSHGYVCDSKGEKMSKSVGNVVDPLDVIKNYGADILRLWAATVDFRSDMRIGDANLKQVSEQYRKIRNSFKFMLGNINPDDFNISKDVVPYKKLNSFDRYMLVKLNKLLENVKTAYEKYDYILVTSLLTNFMTNDLSSYYCDYAKDILYCDQKDSNKRRSIQTVLYNCFKVLVKTWSPILCYTSDEAYVISKIEDLKSVHYSLFDEVQVYEDSEELLTKFSKLNSFRDDVLKALENARANKLIGKALDAHVLINVDEELKQLLLETFNNDINQWLIVSKVSFTNDPLEQFEVSQIHIEKATGTICPRCWNIVEKEDENALCERCKQVLKNSI